MYAIRSYYAKYDEISEFCNRKITDKFDNYGLELVDFVVENISLPEEVEAMLDKKSSMNILGNNIRITSYNVCYTKLLRLKEIN